MAEWALRKRWEGGKGQVRASSGASAWYPPAKSRRERREGLQSREPAVGLSSLERSIRPVLRSRPRKTLLRKRPNRSHSNNPSRGNGYRRSTTKRVSGEFLAPWPWLALIGFPNPLENSLAGLLCDAPSPKNHCGCESRTLNGKKDSRVLSRGAGPSTQTQ